MATAAETPGGGVPAAGVATRSGAAASEPPWVRGSVFLLLIALVLLEGGDYKIISSGESPSWQHGYAVGLHLGKAAAGNVGGNAAPPVPRNDAACHATRKRIAAGTAGPRGGSGRAFDAHDFYEGCISGYRAGIAVTVARLPGAVSPGQ